MSFIDKLGGRKFVLTLVFTLVVMANAVFHIGISWEALLTLAGMYGVYSVSNAVQATKDKTFTNLQLYDTTSMGCEKTDTVSESDAE